MRSLKNQVVILSVIIVFLILEGIALVGLQHYGNENTKLIDRLLSVSDAVNQTWRLEERLESNLSEIISRYNSLQMSCLECHPTRTTEFARHVDLVKQYARIAAEKDRLQVQSAVAIYQLSSTFRYFSRSSHETVADIKKFLESDPEVRANAGTEMMRSMHLLDTTEKLSDLIFEVYDFAFSTWHYYIGDVDRKGIATALSSMTGLLDDSVLTNLSEEEKAITVQITSYMQDVVSAQKEIEAIDLTLNRIETELAANRAGLSGVISKVINKVDEKNRYIGAFVSIVKLISGLSIVLALFWYLKGMLQLRSTVQALTSGVSALKSDYGYRIHITKCLFKELAEVVFTINDLAREVDDRTERLVKEIAEKEQTEKQLKFLTNAVEHSPVSIVLTDAEGNITYVNPKFTEVTGYTFEEAIGKNPRILKSGVHDMEFYRQMWETLKSGHEWHGEFCNKRKDGGLYWELASISPILDKTGSVVNFVAVKEDITEKKKAEEDRFLLDKLKSLGVLAGGIAHDFNNLLTGIIGNISLASTQAKDNPALQKRLDETLKAAERGAGLSAQLLVFAKGGEPVKKAFDIEKLIHDIADFILAGSSITLNISAGLSVNQEKLWSVDGDRNLISQCIANIILNAKQAMHGSGKIDIIIQNANFLQDDPFLQGKFVKIILKDNGPGMSSDVVSRIFEPYFTTKEAGSGLGLATAHSIVQKHGGVMLVSSELGMGTTFTIYLPAVEREEKEMADVPSETFDSADQAVRSARVLVMDDEEQITSLCVDALESLGHDAVACFDGESAIRLYKEAVESGTPFDIVIMDLTIVGGMGGIEACRHIKDMYPEARIVVSSGYSKDPAISSPSEYGFSGVLPKPYKISEMDSVIRKVLETDLS